MQKIKDFIGSDLGKDVFIIFIVILVGLGSFEIGRLSKGAEGSSGVKIEYPVQEATVVSALNSSGTNASVKTKSTSKNFFASSRGSKYYSLSCSGGKSIKEENRVYFASSSEAEAAGYELSSSCK